MADRRDVVHRAVQTLSDGGLVLFPSDTVYVVVAAARSAEGVKRIGALTDRLAGQSEPGQMPVRPTLALARPIEVFRFATDLAPPGRRLVERCLPGPLILTVAHPSNQSELSDLPASARQLVAPADGLAIQVADHAALLQSLRLLGTPVIALGIPHAFDAGAALAAAGPVEALVDDGATRYSKPPTVVRICDQQLDVAFEGILSANRICRLAGEIVTFVCTGNTCRSPMAEGIFKKIVADALCCDPADLSDRGYTILSAGVAAAVGGPPANEAVVIAREYGADIEDHATAPLTSDLVRLSDRIVAMTREHRAVVLEYWPDAAQKTSTLAGAADIADPVGHPLERYRQCAAEMAAHLKSLWQTMNGR